MHTISPKQLQQFVQNQEAMKKEYPGTERARYKLDELIHFLSQVEKMVNSNKQKFPKQFIDLSVVFVRQKAGELLPGYHHDLGAKEASGYSAVIPVLIPNIYRDDNGKGKSEFAYVRDKDGNIPCFLPGGESTGLVPPPPGIDEDYLQVS